MRRCPTALGGLLLVAAVLIAGCGSGSDVPSLKMSGPITKAEATAYAHAVNLAVADVPEMTSTSLEEEKQADASSVHEALCAGAANPHLKVIDVESPEFHLGESDEFIASSVEVMPTASLAAKDLAAVRRTPTLACARNLFAQSFAQEAAKELGLHQGAHVNLGRITASLLPDSLPTAVSFGVRHVVPILSPYRARFYIDSYTAVVGPAEIVLSATGVNHPFPQATEQRLLSLLYNRAKA